MFDQKAKYWRRIREKAEQQKQEAERKQEEASKQAHVDKIVIAIERVGEQLHSQAGENTPEKRRERRWQHAEVIGLWVAATVGVAAILVANHDSTEQYGVLQKQQEIMKGTLDQMRDQERPWIGAPKVSIEVDESGDTQVVMVFQNVGHTPAIGFVVDADVFGDSEGVWDSNARSVCNRWHSKAKDVANGLSVIPGSPWPVNLYEVPIFYAKNKPLKLTDFKNMNKPYVAGCALYVFRLDPEVHHIAFWFKLLSKGNTIQPGPIYSTDAD